MTPTSTPQANSRQLLKATALAALTAGALLLIAVLPAEYGIDPTGIGGALGLTALKSADADAAFIEPAAAPVTPASSLTRQSAEYRTEELAMTLAPGEGGEIKARMLAGAAIVFSWTTEGGALAFDMHGEKLDASDEFSSYWKNPAQERASGSFSAPFDGTHGWYWLNRGSAPVTVTVKVSGFFDTLYRPE